MNADHAAALEKLDKLFNAVRDKEKNMENVFRHLSEQLRILDSQHAVQEDELGVWLDERISAYRPFGLDDEFYPPTLEERSPTAANRSMNDSQLSIQLDADGKAIDIDLQKSRGNSPAHKKKAAWRPEEQAGTINLKGVGTLAAGS